MVRFNNQNIYKYEYCHTNNECLLGSSTIGENFNPAKDCSDIVDNLPEAKDGFYWIKLAKGKLSKVYWCPITLR